MTDDQNLTMEGGPGESHYIIHATQLGLHQVSVALLAALSPTLTFGPTRPPVSPKDTDYQSTLSPFSSVSTLSQAEGPAYAAFTHE